MGESSGLHEMSALSFEHLGAEHFHAWDRLVASDPKFDSPFFRPGFARAVHETGRSVTVVTGYAGSGAVEFLWPLHVDGRTLRPVGWPAADFQGPITTTQFDTVDVLRSTSARTLVFDHLIESATVEPNHVSTWQPSPYLEVAGGLDGYLSRASKSGRSNIGQARRRLAKATAQFGEMTFTPRSDSVELLGQVIDLKRAQYASSGARDYFAERGHIDLLRRLLLQRDRTFSGVLSSVHCGDQLIAAHFGLQSNSVLHWWFPVYEPSVASFSPGWILLRHLVLGAQEMGVQRIDLGRGEDEYKRRAMTGAVMVGQGTVSTSKFDAIARRGAARFRNAVRRTKLVPKVRRTLRAVR